MISIPPELSLDFRPTFVPKTISDFLKEVSLIENVSEKVSKLDDFVRRLEEEMKKIDAFKRELPLCVLLLNDAIVALKMESVQCTAIKAEPVLEEFIPLKNNKEKNHSEEDSGAIITVKKEKDSYNNKKNWMSSVQLWNTNDDNCRSTDRKLDTKRNEEDPFQGYKNREGVRAFLPFKTNLGLAMRKEEKEEIPVAVHGLTLLTPGIKNMKEEYESFASRANCSRADSSSAPNAQSSFQSGLQQTPNLLQHQQPHQTNRKNRRCWSPELHRRFVRALQQLGGSQVATPKQIRELMQVEGLTNDEVKSHLQKYRLHTRKIPPRSTTSHANQSVVLGSALWMSQDQYGETSKGSSSQSGSPQGPLQLAAYTAGTSTTGGDSMEDDEDAKSEGYSWKSHINKPRNDDDDDDV